MISRSLALIFFSLFFLIYAEANQCIDGSDKNFIFKKAIQNSDASLVRQFRAETAFRPTQAQLGCASGKCSTVIDHLVLKAPTVEIPKDCIKASLKRKVAQTSIECRRQSEGKWQLVKHSARSKLTPCFDGSTVDYIHYVTNKVIGCFNGLPMKNGAVETIDSKVLYSKINNESGFNFTYSYDGGVGAGQLTGNAVQEMNVLNPSRTKGRTVKGNGRFVLDAILSSQQSACQGLKPIIENDLKIGYHSPRILKSSAKTVNCEWVSLETGLARNLIYSMGYFAYLKHEILGKELKKRAPMAYNDPELLNMLTMVAYGPKGMNRALTLIRTLNMRSASSLSSIKQQIKKEEYINATANKLNEVKRMAGESCQLL